MFTEKFNSLSSIVGLSKDEVATAKFFWYAGVKYALKMNPTVPALLKPKEQLGASKADFSKDYNKRYNNPEDKITPYEAKFVSLVLANFLSELDVIKREIKLRKKRLWNYCDPADKSTEHYFNLLNKAKADAERLKTQQNTLARFQRKLKKIAKQ